MVSISSGNRPPPGAPFCKDAIIEKKVIPLILCPYTTPDTGKQILLFKNQANLTRNELCQLDRKTFHLAKLIIENDGRVIKLGEETNNLSFDEIHYNIFFNGKQLTGSHKKGDHSIEIMDKEETDEIKVLFTKTLLSSDREEALTRKEKEEIHKSPSAFPIKNVSTSDLSTIKFVLAALQNLNSTKWRQQIQNLERKEQEKEAFKLETNKREYKNKEGLWHQKRKHFEAKEENQRIVLEYAKVLDLLNIERYHWTIPPKLQLL